eukprot:scaffold109_cov252-Pinguiococcus_pyrenoidosus.AAC.88
MRCPRKSMTAESAFLLLGLKVSMNNNALRRLSPGVQNWRNVRELFLNGNALEALPIEIGRMESLQKLWVVANQLQALPTTIGELMYLEELYASKNPKLGQVPVELSLCPSLKKMFFDNCSLTKFPLQVLTPPRDATSPPQTPKKKDLKMAKAVVADEVGEEDAVEAVASEAVAEPVSSPIHHAASADDLKWGSSPEKDPEGGDAIATVAGDAESKVAGDGTRRLSGTWFATKVVKLARGQA